MLNVAQLCRRTPARMTVVRRVFDKAEDEQLKA
jgi:hypothetical protein